MPMSFGEEHDLDPRWILDILARDFKPRATPRAAPTVGIFDEPTVCTNINVEWLGHIIGVLEALLQPDAWLGDDSEHRRIEDNIHTLLEFTGENCMVCCEEQVAIAQEALWVAYQNTSQQWITNNYNQTVTNQQFYDGTPQSIFPNAGATFGATGDEILCAAIEVYLDNMMSGYAQQAAAMAWAAGAAASAITAIAVALGAITVGMSIPIGLVLSGIVGGSAALWQAMLADEEAQRKVRCCMFDALVDADITPENFAMSASDCGFTGGHEQTLSAQVNGTNQMEGNYTAFLRALSLAREGSTAPCECDCDINAYNLVAMDNCTVEKLTDTTYRITQTNIDPSDPARPNARTALIREEFYRCFKIADEGLQGQSDSSYRDCAGVDHYTLGGFEGVEGIRFQFRQWENDIDTIITIECSE